MYYPKIRKAASFRTEFTLLLRGSSSQLFITLDGLCFGHTRERRKAQNMCQTWPYTREKEGPESNTTTLQLIKKIHTILKEKLIYVSEKHICDVLCGVVDILALF